MALLDSIDRRGFLKALGSTGALGAVAPQTLLADSAEPAPLWQNWSGNQQANPNHFLFPRDEKALRSAVTAGTGTIRPFGGSHSFSAVVPSDDTLVSLEALAGFGWVVGAILGGLVYQILMSKPSTAPATEDMEAEA